MKKYKKIALLELAELIGQAHEELSINIDANNIEQAMDILAACQESAIHIGNSIEESEGEGLEIIGCIGNYCETLFQVNNSMMMGENQAGSIEILKNYHNSIEAGINAISCKKEIVFLPYKASMWDSMESIWMTAKEDSECECYVMPIPYYDRTEDRRLGEMYYEGDQLPGYVPITKYTDYNLSVCKPDIIYFHNPYDQYNYVTSVHPAFYSSELIKYTNMLVYVPYFIAGAYKNVDDIGTKHIISGVVSSNRVIVQSELMKQIMVSLEMPAKKIAALGSPKIDAVINAMKNPPEVPDEWKEKLSGKKIVLYNTSIGSMLVLETYMERFERFVRQIIYTEGIGLIWRPHPLLEATIKSMRPQYMERFKKLTNDIANSENAVIDKLGSAYAAISYSDGLISDTSSLLRQYMVTGKPVLALNLKSSMREERICLFDHFSCYFLGDGVRIGNFLTMLKKGEDPNKALREEDVRRSVANSDGTCGEKIHKYIMSQLDKADKTCQE
ncbi:MAG TPA: CDP-glycerol glycerophosphotransferase family protein [Clostridia bacterium]|nr:CDP-glycerol glycerophosphotransferase family protein [Clostridia bacterium]